jgi:hypothetical protein
VRPRQAAAVFTRPPQSGPIDRVQLGITPFKLGFTWTNVSRATRSGIVPLATQQRPWVDRGSEVPSVTVSRPIHPGSERIARAFSRKTRAPALPVIGPTTLYLFVANRLTG